jgi:plasmid stabilization system protein ParE
VNRLVYRPEAEADVHMAFDWYERQREGLGDQFLAELAKAEDVVRTNPLAFRVLQREARRVLLRRFPYQLIYRVVEDAVVILACFHGRRSPRRLEGRS